jgi:hypothetical protein
VIVADWLWSTAFYSGAIIFIAGAIGVIRPFRGLHRRSRRRAAIIAFLGLGVMFAIARWSAPRPHSSGELAGGLDEFLPSYHFRERHQIVIDAPAADVFAAIKATTADEIALFNLFTTIRRFGRPGPESILNAPGRQPLLDVAVRGGFILLQDRPPHETIVGTIVVAPPGTRRPASFTAADFRQMSAPGFALAAMNFRVEAISASTSRVITETRVHATDDAALARFTPYWRIIFPGSSILRATWLRAIKTRAEGAVS